MTKEDSLKVRRKQLLAEIPLEMKRVAGLAESAGELSEPKHPSHEALNRALTALDEALKALEAT